MKTLKEIYDEAKADLHRRMNPPLEELLERRRKLEVTKSLMPPDVVDTMFDAHWRANEADIARARNA